MDTLDTDSASAYDYYLRLTTSSRLDDRARQPTTSEFRVNYKLRLDGPYDRRYGECFGYAPTVTIAVRKRHYPRDRLVLRVPRLRVLPRLRLFSVRCLHVFTFHVPSLYQPSI